MQCDELRFDQALGIYLERNQSADFSYADGSEQYLLSVLENVGDKSSLSGELRRHIKDWPSLYHLSLERANLLRCFLFSGAKKASVLELGAGCGAITRYLGETFAAVCVLEGSLPRCQCIRKRCSDLENVRVICGNFLRIPWKQFQGTFDMVTLIGVLEYGPLYAPAPENATLATLQLAYEALKENGLLVVAIENKFGLKYWSGAREDHVGGVFEGIQGYPSQRGPVTYSRRELDSLLRQAGFQYVEWYLPFPDYKLPDVIINAQIPSLANHFIYNWIETPFPDRGYPKRLLLFNESLATREVTRSGLLPELANSFLILAYKGHSEEVDALLGLDKNWIAKKYALRRASCFNKCTKLLPSSPPRVTHERLAEAWPKICKHKNVIQRLEDEDFIPGDLLTLRIFEAIAKGKFEEELVWILKIIKNFILDNFSIKSTGSAFPLVDGRAFDAVVFNFVMNGQQLYFIDREWEIVEPLPLDYILFRNLWCLYSRHAAYLPLKGQPVEQWIVRCIQQVLPGYDHNRLRLNIEQEKQISSVIANAEPKEVNTSLSYCFSSFTSLVILTRNNLEYTKMCLESVRRYTPEPHEIIVVDNGSTDGTVEYLKTQPDVKLIENGYNLGFALGNNRGLQEAKGDYIVFLNNDVVVTEGWLTRLLACAQEDPKVGAVGPRSNYVAGLQIVPQVPYGDDMEAMHNFARNWSLENAGKWETVPRVIGFCMLVKRAVIEKIGGFDPVFGTGNFEDDDFCLRLQLAGFTVKIAHDVFVHHFGSKTFQSESIDYRKLMQKNWELFKRKWGLPQDARMEQGYVPAKLLQGTFLADKHFVPLHFPALPLEGLREKKYLAEFHPQVVRWFVERYTPEDPVTLILYHPVENAFSEVKEFLEQAGYDEERIPDILIYPDRLPEAKIPELVATSDVVLLDGAESSLLSWGIYLGKEIVFLPS